MNFFQTTVTLYTVYYITLTQLITLTSSSFTRSSPSCSLGRGADFTAICFLSLVPFPVSLLLLGLTVAVTTSASPLASGESGFIASTSLVNSIKTHVVFT